MKGWEAEGTPDRWSPRGDPTPSTETRQPRATQPWVTALPTAQ